MSSIIIIFPILKYTSYVPTYLPALIWRTRACCIRLEHVVVAFITALVLADW